MKTNLKELIKEKDLDIEFVEPVNFHHNRTDVTIIVINRVDDAGIASPDKVDWFYCYPRMVEFIDYESYLEAVLEDAEFPILEILLKHKIINIAEVKAKRRIKEYYLKRMKIDEIIARSISYEV